MTVEEVTRGEASSQLTTEYAQDGLCRILSLDGGGAKGFYTLGVLKEIEAMLGCPLYKRFDLIFGTSTGAIIASLVALGYEIDAIHALYKKHVPSVMRASNARIFSRSISAWRSCKLTARPPWGLPRRTVANSSAWRSKNRACAPRIGRCRLR